MQFLGALFIILFILIFVFAIFMAGFAVGVVALTAAKDSNWNQYDDLHDHIVRTSLYEALINKID